MTKKEILLLIDAEIEWCKQHAVSTMPDVYEKGFINGLKQAKILIKKYNISK